MISIHGTYLNGAVVLDQPVNLPEGAHVCVTSDDNADVCCDGSRWDDSAEGRPKWLEWFDALGPALSNEEAEQLPGHAPHDAQRAEAAAGAARPYD